MPAIRFLSARVSKALLAGACAVAVAAVLAPVSPWAQESTGLRGAFPAQRPDPLAPQRPEPLAPANASLPAYRPISPGAAPQATAPAEQELLGARPRVPAPEQPRAARPAPVPTPATRASRSTRPQQPDTATAQDEDGQTVRTRPRTRAGELASPQEDRSQSPNTASVRLDSEDLERNTAIRAEAERLGPVETRGATAGTEPFAAQGIRVGRFLLRPSLEQGVEWSSNASSSAGGSADLLSATTLRLRADSEWSRHALSLDATASWRQSLRGTGFSELTGSAGGALRLDLGGGFVSNSRLGYALRPETADMDVATVGRPLRQTVTAETGLAKTVGPVLLSARAAAERNIYADATLDGGGTVSQRDRNNTLYALTLRGGYELSPSLQPFVEAEIGRRVRDVPLDADGFARSATRYGARAGLAFDRGEKFSGEAAIGWLSERPDDQRLAGVSGLSVDANLGWSPLRGTRIDLGARTEIEATALAGAAGALVYGVTLGATRELSARLTGSALLSAELRRYAGTADSDTTLAASASLTWWLNRYAGVTGRLGHERMSSTIGTRGYEATTVYLGLTLQR